MSKHGCFIIGISLITASCQGWEMTNNEGIDTTAVAVKYVQSDSLYPTPDSITISELPEPDRSLGSSSSIDTRDVPRESLVQFAETLLGIPYVYASSDPKIGFDCSGFITYVFNNFNIKVPRSSVDFTDEGREIGIEEARRGDIILFTGTNPLERIVGHMGIIVSNTDTLKFIHSTSGRAMGVTISPLSPGYQKRFMKTIRVFKD